jgi:hypothetical protein
LSVAAAVVVASLLFPMVTVLAVVVAQAQS